MNEKKEKPRTKEIGGEKYFYLWSAADYLGMSERSLSREINRKHIRWLDHLGGKFILPAWCDEWVLNRIQAPRPIKQTR